MADIQWTDDELRLIERLGRAPQPALNPAQMEVIKMSMLQNIPTAPVPTPTPFTPWLFALGGGVIGIMVTIIVVVVVIFQPGSNGHVPPIEQTLTAVATYLPSATPTATVTGTLTSTPLPATATASATLDPSVTVSPVTPTLVVTGTTTAQASPTAQGTVTVTSTPAGDVIIIEGPVTNININIITIYNFTIVVAPDDPILTTINIGDIIRVEGALDDDDGQIVIIAITIINITIINLPPDQGGSGDWTDDGSCANAPPPWAPAHGWRRRCEGGGKDKDDDDDDD
ncbi:MAG: hypothetical protein J0M33_11035 [Anaerolineae bacterium]|nr:hypothetical protein [Anaerolineae bacterium]